MLVEKYVDANKFTVFIGNFGGITITAIRGHYANFENAAVALLWFPYVPLHTLFLEITSTQCKTLFTCS